MKKKMHSERTLRGQLERMTEDRDFFQRCAADFETKNANQLGMIQRLERDCADMKRERDWVRQMCQHLVEKIPGARS